MLINRISDRQLILIEIKVFIVIIFLLISIKSFHQNKPNKEIIIEKKIYVQNDTSNKADEIQDNFIKESITKDHVDNPTEKNNSGNVKKRFGFISSPHDDNIDHNLFKYAIFIKLKELGFDPYIIGYIKPNIDFSFLNKTTNLINIKKTLKEINKNEYDFLIIHNIQKFKKEDKKILYWDIPKFLYEAPPGFINGISLKDKKIIKNNLKYEPNLILLEPIILIDSQYYKEIIKDYKNEFKADDNYIFNYRKNRNKFMEIFIKKEKKLLNYKVYNCYTNDSVKNFYME